MDGGALYIAPRAFYFVPVAIVNVTMQSNSASRDGATAWTATGGAPLTIEGSRFSLNTGGNKGGVLVTGAGNVTISGCSFSGHSTYYEGCGVYVLNSGDVRISNSNFTSNVLNVTGAATYGNWIYYGRGGGVYVESSGRVAVAGSHFEDNRAHLIGGALMVNMSGPVEVGAGVCAWACA